MYVGQDMDRFPDESFPETYYKREIMVTYWKPGDDVWTYDNNNGYLYIICLAFHEAKINIEFENVFKLIEFKNGTSSYLSSSLSMSKLSSVS